MTKDASRILTWREGILYCFKMPEAQSIRSFSGIPGHLNLKNLCSLSPDGRWVACKVNGKVKVWTLADARDEPLLQRVCEGCEFAFSPDGDLMALFDSWVEPPMQLFDTAEWKILHTGNLPAGTYPSTFDPPFFSDNGSHVALSSANNQQMAYMPDAHRRGPHWSIVIWKVRNQLGGRTSLIETRNADSALELKKRWHLVRSAQSADARYTALVTRAPRRMEHVLHLLDLHNERGEQSIPIAENKNRLRPVSIDGHAADNSSGKEDERGN